MEMVIKELSEIDVVEELRSSDTLKKIPKETDIRYIGFQEGNGLEREKWCILSIEKIKISKLKIFEDIFKDYFGSPIKDYNEQVIPGSTVPVQYIPLLNKMNGFLLLGIALRIGCITLEQLVDILVEQQGGCNNPPINLGVHQSFYGKSTDCSRKSELVRICPHHLGGYSAIEYMVHKQNRVFH